MNGLDRVENENDIMHYKKSLHRKKDGIPGVTVDGQSAVDIF